MDEQEQNQGSAPEIEQRPQQEKGNAVDWANNQVNRFRNGKRAINAAKRFFKKGNPAEKVAEQAAKQVAKTVVKQIAQNAIRQLVIWLLTIGGGTFLLFLIILLIILFPIAGGVGEGAPIPPGGQRNIPPPGPASSSISETAENLTRILLANCGSRVNIDNLGCAKAVYNGGIKYPDLAYNEIIQSVLYFSSLQCVGFVNAAVGGATGIPFPRFDDAKDYVRDIPGFAFVPVGSGTISAGDIPVWGDPRQHIAIAVEIFSQSLFRIAEANWDKEGGVKNESKRGHEDNFKGWLRKL